MLSEENLGNTEKLEETKVTHSIVWKEKNHSNVDV